VFGVTLIHRFVTLLATPRVLSARRARHSAGVRHGRRHPALVGSVAEPSVCWNGWKATISRTPARRSGSLQRSRRPAQKRMPGDGVLIERW
jgi:hypothetical protein